jgi:methylated-DNA-[protein]-cysteine S-methyltransferase
MLAAPPSRPVTIRALPRAIAALPYVRRDRYRQTMITMERPTATAQYLRRIESPIGRIEITSNGTAITSLAIEKDGWLPFSDQPELSNDVLDRAAAQLEEYFDGQRHTFDVPVELSGTEFQKQIWSKLVELEWGEVASYGELGLATGRPTAGRAVGGAVGANPVPIIVPCHRVLATGGRITGYSAGEGVATKAWLLEHEGIAHN